jgi:putative tryptophan/tyrosine transport system substrate-binding protein
LNDTRFRKTDRPNDFAVELVQLPVDLIVAFNTPSAHAAKRATTAIPIVFSAGDSVGTGLVTSLAHPGGNITGIGGSAAELGGKCLELLRELLPTVSHVAALVHATDQFARPFLAHIESAAQSLGVRIHPVVVRGVEDLNGAFMAIMQE